jgi:hypothetical protein
MELRGKMEGCCDGISLLARRAMLIVFLPVCRYYLFVKRGAVSGAMVGVVRRCKGSSS